MASKNFFPSICQMSLLLVFKKLAYLEIYFYVCIKLGFNIFLQMDSQSSYLLHNLFFPCSVKAPLSRKSSRSREKHFCYQDYKLCIYILT